MKYRWDKKYLYWGVTAICVIVVSLLVFAAIFEFKGVLSVIGFIFRILSPVLYGFAIAYLLTPLVNKLDRIQMKTYFKNAKKPHKAQKAARAISVVASILLLLGILIGLCMMLIPQLITNILGFTKNIESYFYNLEDWINGLVGQNSSFCGICKSVFRSGKADDSWVDVCRLSAAAPKYIGKCNFYIMVSIFCICRYHHRHDYSHILFVQQRKICCTGEKGYLCTV